ncbi:MAG: GNAT family N-acetyltransferase [Gammaproteobacteria bacterium]|nr:GNAT family N-acetyltransferase [Gammaproteobacteria bacterium]
MTEDTVIETPRLRLRLWRESDLEPFRAINADAEVMRHFPKTLDAEESDAVAGRIISCQQDFGFCFWALEDRQDDRFIGFAGLNVPRFEAHFTPCVEIGWRLASDRWGKGLATEAASAALGHGFDVLGLAEIVAFAVPENAASLRVMEKIGMTRDGDFEHPSLPKGHNRTVLYRIQREDFRRTA